MKKKFNSFFSMGLQYSEILSNHGVKHHPVNKIASSYGSFKEFKDNAKAPIQISIAILSSNLRAIIGCVENTIYLALNMVTLDFSDARNNMVNMLNNISAMLFNSYKALLDISLSLIELPINSILTLKDFIAPEDLNEAALSSESQAKTHS